MSKSASTRRNFLKGGVFAAPFAVSAPAAALADNGMRTRMARLEDEKAIREVHQAWLGRVNSGESPPPGEASRITASGRQADLITLAADGLSATGRYHCAVETCRVIAPDCTAARMAHAQGSGFIRQTRERLLTVSYRKVDGAWRVAKAELGEA